MSPKTIPLGTNAFDAERESFFLVNTESEKKSLQKQGKRNGRVNSPDSQTLQPDAVEQEIVQKIAQTVQQTQTALSQHFVSFNARLMPIVNLWDPTALINKIQTMPNEVENNLSKIFHTFETESNIKGDKWQDAKKEYKDFRQKNKLTRIPDYQPLGKSIRLFVILIVLEAALNATLLWEFTGILAAFGQTALITAVNVVFGAGSVGLCFRYKNHVSWTTRWLTLICVPVVLAVLLFNLGVGHYRDALVEAIAQENQLSAPLIWDDANVAESVEIIIDHTKKAMESMRTSPLGIESILSGLLIIVGIGFFGFAAWKWYFMYDPYPGYKTCDLAQKHTHEDYKKLVENTRNKIDGEIKVAAARVCDERTKVMNMGTEHNDLSNRANALQTNYASWILVLGKAQNFLVTAYRDSNRKMRSEPAPNYFNDKTAIDPNLTIPPNFDPQELQNVDQVVETVRKAEHEIQKSADEIWKKFNRLTNMQSKSDGSQST